LGSSYEQDRKRTAVYDRERYHWFSWYCSLDLYRKKLCSMHFRGNFEFIRSVDGHSVGCEIELGEGFLLRTSLREGIAEIRR
jgi:hypothetical protein